MTPQSIRWFGDPPLPGPLFLLPRPPRPPWRGAHSCLRGQCRVGPQDEKSSNLHITADSTGSIHKNARGKKFDPKKVRLGCGDLIWKFGIWAFSPIFVLFLWVAKTLIYIDSAFNGYSYLKSTRKELSDGTLMLKKEYRLARWNCDWKSYTFPKKYPPARENDQNSTKSTKWLKITFRGSKMVPKVSKWGFWGGICIEKWY